MSASNDDGYGRLERERRKCSEKQIQLLRLALDTDAYRELVVPSGYIAAASGLQRRELIFTYRPTVGYSSWSCRRPRYLKGSRRTYRLTDLGRALAMQLPPRLLELRLEERDPMNAYHTTTDHGARVVVVFPGGETEPLHPSDAEMWGRYILAAVARAREAEHAR